MKATFKIIENILSADYSEGFGNLEEEIKEKEKSLGIKFPKVLREYYQKYGRCKYIKQNCNNQYEPIELKDIFVPNEEFFTKDKNYLVFYQCKESVIYCGIKFSDLSLDDPPVYLCVWNGADWHFENYSLSNFLVCKALIQIAVEGRLPYWEYFDESILGVSDYLEVWEIESEKSELEETAPNLTYRIFIKDDVLIIFESALDEDKDYILSVSLGAFKEENIKRLKLNIEK